MNTQPTPRHVPGAIAHSVKCWPEFFEEILADRKKFDLRKNDRSYAVDDWLELHEWQPDRREEDCKEGAASGRILTVRITCITSGLAGLKEGYVILGIQKL